MTNREKFRLDVAQARYADRKIVVARTVADVRRLFPEGITLAEIEGILSDIRSELASGLITYTAPLDMAEENADMAKRYMDRISGTVNSHESVNA